MFEVFYKDRERVKYWDRKIQAPDRLREQNLKGALKLSIPFIVFFIFLKTISFVIRMRQPSSLINVNLQMSIYLCRVRVEF